MIHTYIWSHNYRVIEDVHHTHKYAWVFGMVDTSVTPVQGYMEIVAQRDAATLLPILPG